MTTAQKIVDSSLLAAAARISMALFLPTVGLLATLTSNNIAQLDKAQTAALTATTKQFELQNKILDDKLTQIVLGLQSDRAAISSTQRQLGILEVQQRNDAARFQSFEQSFLGKHDKLQDTIVALSTQLSALTASLQSVVQERRDSHKDGAL
jgi:hypothetical protein